MFFPELTEPLHERCIFLLPEHFGLNSVPIGAALIFDDLQGCFPRKRARGLVPTTLIVAPWCARARSRVSTALILVVRARRQLYRRPAVPSLPITGRTRFQGHACSPIHRRRQLDSRRRSEKLDLLVDWPTRDRALELHASRRYRRGGRGCSGFGVNSGRFVGRMIQPTLHHTRSSCGR